MNIRERIARFFHPLQVRAVQLFIGALIASVLTTWWLTNVGPSINHRVAAEQSFELWLVASLVLAVSRMTPRTTNEQREITIPRSFYWFAFIIGGFTAALLIYWVTSILPGASVGNIVKAHASLILVVSTIVLIVQTVRRVEDGHRYRQMLERRAREPVDYSFLR